MDLIILFLLLINIGIMVFSFIVFTTDYKKNHMKVVGFVKKERIKSKLEIFFKNERTKTRQIMVSIVFILLAVLAIVVGTSIVWIPLIIWIRHGFHSAYFSVAILMIALSGVGFMVLIKNKLKGYTITEGVIIKEVIIVSTIIYGVILVIFGFNFTIYEVMEATYLKAAFFRNTFTILVPILSVSSVITNVYLILNGIFDFITIKTKDTVWRTKMIDLILIFIAASFLGILYITETNFLFITAEEFPSFLETLSVFKILLSSILIPLVFRKLYITQMQAMVDSK